MERKPVTSGASAEVGYDRETQVLEVLFPSGSIWQYAKVPQEVYDKFMRAESLGRFFAADIRSCYVATCMNPKPKKEEQHAEAEKPAEESKSVQKRKTAQKKRIS
jgi:hypothetical protein